VLDEVIDAGAVAQSEVAVQEQLPMQHNLGLPLQSWLVSSWSCAGLVAVFAIAAAVVPEPV
jgi:hypothetical protein